MFVAVCLSPSLQAKGPTTRIVITAPALPAPLEITDPAVIDQFAIWAGRATSLDGRCSSISKFANRPAESQAEHLAYVVMYTPDDGSGRGYVYLPGRGEQHFALNVKTIFRGVEGHWFKATDAWDRTVGGLLRAQR